MSNENEPLLIAFFIMLFVVVFMFTNSLRRADIESEKQAAIRKLTHDARVYLRDGSSEQYRLFGTVRFYKDIAPGDMVELEDEELLTLMYRCDESGVARQVLSPSQAPKDGKNLAGIEYEALSCVFLTRVEEIGFAGMSQSNG
jgi:hypothetical protein